MGKRKPAVPRAVEEYQVICGWREPDGRHETHRSPQYAGPLEARGWADSHRFEDHGGALDWVMDLMYYPPGRIGYVIDRWTPLGLGSPDPGRWHGAAVAASDAQTLEGQGAGRAQVAAIRAALAQVENPTLVQVGTRRMPVLAGEPATVVIPRLPGRRPAAQAEEPEPAPCGHPATAYDEGGNPLCELEECRV